MDNFKKAILDFNRQLTPSALRYFRLNKLKNSKPDAIIIVGMGGSGQAGFLTADLKSELKIPAPVVIWENYGLPKTNYKKPLYIFVSFSGNTKETISGFSKAKLKAVICSGGNLKILAEKTGSPLTIIPANNLAPRQANGLLFYGIIKIIKIVYPSVKTIPLTKLNPKSLEKTGSKIAKKLKKKTVLIYSSPKNNHLSYIWKTNLNETAKTPAFAGTFPEMAHNEIVTFINRPKNLIIIFLENVSNDIQNKKKIGIVIKLLKKYGVPALRIKLNGKNELEKTWNSVILAQWVSYYLAKIKKVEPTETKLIDQIKELTK